MPILDIPKENKKIKAPIWLIALINYIIAGVFFPFVSMLGGSILMYPLLSSRLAGLLATILGVYIFTIIGIWVGVMTSAKYLFKKYEITDKDLIIKFSVYLAVAFFIFSTLYSFYKSGFIYRASPADVTGPINIFFLYYFSKVYFHKDPK